MRKVLATLSFTAVLALQATVVEAATATGSFGVQVIIDETCEVSSPSTVTLDFGSQTLLNSNVDQQTAIQVECSNGTDYDITLNGGLNNNRSMRLGATSNYVDYELYTDSSRLNVWPTTSSSFPYTGNGTPQTIPVYGRIPAQAAPTASATPYTDVVQITVWY